MTHHVARLAGALSALAIVSATVPAIAASSARTYFSVAAERRYAWADTGRSPFAGGATIAIVSGRSPRSALRALAPHSATPIESPAAVERWASRGSYREERNSIEALPLGHGWTLIVNDLGYRATMYPALRRLSANGRALVIYEDVELNSSFQVASRSHITRDFAPVDYTRPWVGHPSRAERAIRFGDSRDWHSMAKSMLLVARLTGVRLSLARINSTVHRIAVGVRH